MLELRNITKMLAGEMVLNNLSLRVERGETLVIVGSSGAGKSVALQNMIGLIKPDSGEVLVDNQPLHNARGSRLQQLRRKFGMLFQGAALINWMNIFDNVALPLRENSNLTEAEIAVRVRDSLALVNLSEAAGKMPVELSGGMLKRAGLARAIILEPPIILYDEPTAGLDPVMSRNIDHLVKYLQSHLRVTSVVVTHDLISAFSIGDKVALLHDGRIVSIGTPMQFRRDPSPHVQRFIEAQLMNHDPVEPEKATGDTKP